MAQSDAAAERQSAQRVERENRSVAAREAREDAEKKTKRVVMVGEPGPVKIPGAILLILIGLVVLWLATTGQLDRIGNAWSYILGHSDLPTDGKTQAQVPAKPASATAKLTLLDTPTYHVATLMSDSDAPGGMYQVAVAQLVTPSASQVAWASFGVLILLIVSAVDARVGGWLLLLIVVGMVYSAQTRGLL